jgi:isoaspartyl peptidase/L-asparaginase-like protein (Ntn-hydrolase superfamily)
MNTPNRREFISRSLIFSSTALLSSKSLSAASQPRVSTSDFPVIISTWPFGKLANDRALEILKGGGSILDAVEKGINVVEDDPETHSVGLQGIPNAEGIVQLDACIMDGRNHKAGSVAALERIANPISVARHVMEQTKNVMLVGPGAQEFAVKQGFKLEPPRQRESTASPKAAPVSELNHDTIALVVLSRDAELAGGCSTSGLGHKLPGRVGDSPIIGSGLYVDGEVGGAGATGVGENVMRFCATFMIVEFMRQGMHPTKACVEAIKRIRRKHPSGTNLEINFVALNRKGEFGAAGTGKGFPYSVTTAKFSKVLQSEVVN